VPLPPMPAFTSADIPTFGQPQPKKKIPLWLAEHVKKAESLKETAGENVRPRCGYDVVDSIGAPNDVWWLAG
jgi:hypothetical protein